MVGDPLTEQEPNGRGFDQADRLGRPERIALLLAVGIFVAVDAYSIIAERDTNVLLAVLSIAMTLTLTLYLWSPPIATAVLAVVVVQAFLAGTAVENMAAAAFAALFVLRLGAIPLIMAYVAGLLVSSALLSSGLGTGGSGSANVTALLLVATVSGAVGYALRVSAARGRRLEHALADQAAEQEAREREAVLAERRWIAGELHDSIAHHLTVISLHSQLLDDERARTGSQEAIQSATRKALSDLRFVISIADDAPSSADVPTGDLVASFEEATEEFIAAGHPTVIEGEPADEGIPRGVEIILARIVRESATNILKYAGPGQVSLCLNVEPDAVRMTICSPIPLIARRNISSTGTGLNRMAERVLGVSGEFSAGPVNEEWVVTACLPISASSDLDRSADTPTELEAKSVSPRRRRRAAEHGQDPVTRDT